ncbi:MAG: DNA-3-methyladenine glycosylase 2 family protein [Clostridia bacterium]|nr:DNA-3-methyladenine glycosylase 2 family protein [Clostridia bacterium]
MTETRALLAEKIQYGRLSAVRVRRVKHFDVRKIFDCGQSFRFDPVTESSHEIEYAGCANGKYVSIAQDEDEIYIYNVDLEEYEQIWQAFLGLDRDYDEINRSILSLSDNPALRDAVMRGDGIRILNQDGWEAICSFIISQNNNIPRIKKLITSLCLACGEQVDVSIMEGHVADAHKNADGHFYSFPSPEKVLSLGIPKLYELKMGFRAKYIQDAAEKAASGEIDFSLLRSAKTERCIQHLCAVKGIGPKVASCALLFGFGKLDTFPIDVWIKKATVKYFDSGFSPEHLGEYAGVAQQYLFYYERYLQQ